MIADGAAPVSGRPRPSGRARPGDRRANRRKPPGRCGRIPPFPSLGVHMFLALRGLPALLEIGLLIFCLIEVIQTPADETRNLSKGWWIVLIIQHRYGLRRSAHVNYCFQRQTSERAQLPEFCLQLAPRRVDRQRSAEYRPANQNNHEQST